MERIRCRHEATGIIFHVQVTEHYTEYHSVETYGESERVLVGLSYDTEEIVIEGSEGRWPERLPGTAMIRDEHTVIIPRMAVDRIGSSRPYVFRLQDFYGWTITECAA